MKFFLLSTLLLVCFNSFALIIGDPAPKKTVKHYYPDGSKGKALLTSRKEGTNLLIVHGFSHCPWFKISIHHLTEFKKKNPHVYIKLLVSDKVRAEIDDFLAQYHGKIPFVIMTSNPIEAGSVSVELNARYSASFFFFDKNDQLNGRYVGAALPRTHKFFKKLLEK